MKGGRRGERSNKRIGMKCRIGGKEIEGRRRGWMGEGIRHEIVGLIRVMGQESSTSNCRTEGGKATPKEVA